MPLRAVRVLFVAVISGHDGAPSVPGFQVRHALVSLSQADSASSILVTRSTLRIPYEKREKRQPWCSADAPETGRYVRSRCYFARGGRMMALRRDSGMTVRLIRATTLHNCAGPRQRGAAR